MAATSSSLPNMAPPPPTTRKRKAEATDKLSSASAASLRSADTGRKLIGMPQLDLSTLLLYDPTKVPQYAETELAQRHHMVKRAEFYGPFWAPVKECCGFGDHYHLIVELIFGYAEVLLRFEEPSLVKHALDLVTNGESKRYELTPEENTPKPSAWYTTLHFTDGTQVKFNHIEEYFAHPMSWLTVEEATESRRRSGWSTRSFAGKAFHTLSAAMTTRRPVSSGQDITPYDPTRRQFYTPRRRVNLFGESSDPSGLDDFACYWFKDDDPEANMMCRASVAAHSTACYVHACSYCPVASADWDGARTELEVRLKSGAVVSGCIFEEVDSWLCAQHGLTQQIVDDFYSCRSLCSNGKRCDVMYVHSAHLGVFIQSTDCIPDTNLCANHQTVKKWTLIEDYALNGTIDSTEELEEEAGKLEPLSPDEEELLRAVSKNPPPPVPPAQAQTMAQQLVAAAAAVVAAQRLVAAI
jgi:hypothetical protein